MKYLLQFTKCIKRRYCNYCNHAIMKGEDFLLIECSKEWCTNYTNICIICLENLFRSVDRKEYRKVGKRHIINALRKENIKERG